MSNETEHMMMMLVQGAASVVENAFRRAAQDITTEMIRPSVLFRPHIFIDGDRWCALYGNNIQDGVCGFGKSPDEATYAFDRAWSKTIGGIDEQRD